MTGKTHQVIGITAGLGWYLLHTTPAYGPATLASVLVGSSLLALLPDTDQATGAFWHKVPGGHRTGAIISKAWLGHRNLSHSLLGFGMVGGLLYLLLSHFPEYWGINHAILITSCLISYTSHLLADAFTVEGIPLLYPYQRMFGIPPKPFDRVRIETGEWFESLVVFPCFNILLIVLIATKWSRIMAILFHP